MIWIATQKQTESLNKIMAVCRRLDSEKQTDVLVTLIGENVEGYDINRGYVSDGCLQLYGDDEMLPNKLGRVLSSKDGKLEVRVIYNNETVGELDGQPVKRAEGFWFHASKNGFEPISPETMVKKHNLLSRIKGAVSFPAHSRLFAALILLLGLFLAAPMFAQQ